MDESENRQVNTRPVSKLAAILILVVISLFVGYSFIPVANRFPSPDGPLTKEKICASNISGLAKSIWVYSQDNDNKIPTPDKWCDLLIQYADVQKKQFICLRAKKAGSKMGSHYAINPNARLDSQEDIVLLFETTGGWNQFGGAELITAENHKGEGCNVGFVSTRVDFVRKEDFGKLNWGDEKVGWPSGN